MNKKIIQKLNISHINFFIFLAKISRLSNEETGIYIKMLHHLLTHSKTQYSFIDTDTNWLYFTGLNDITKLKIIRKTFLNFRPYLFKTHTQDLDNIITCVFLKKHYLSQRRRSKIYSTNARCRSKLITTPPAIVETITDTIITTSPSPSPSPLETINFMLRPFLSKSQIARILTMMPSITPQYVIEKIDLIKDLTFDNKSSFLYASILHNYTKTDSPNSSENLLLKSKTNPISEKEYLSLSDELKLLFKAVQHQKPGISTYVLSKIPPKILASERFAFKNLTIGDAINTSTFLKLRLKTQLFFTRNDLQPKTILMYHLKNP